MVVVNAKSNIRSMEDLARGRAKQLSAGSSGNGTPPHLTLALYQKLTGTALMHVPYKGAPSLTDLIGGHLDVVFSNYPESLPHVRAALRALAITTRERTADLPEVPTVAGRPAGPHRRELHWRAGAGRHATGREPHRRSHRPANVTARLATVAGATGLRAAAARAGGLRRLPESGSRALGPHHPRRQHPDRLIPPEHRHAHRHIGIHGRPAVDALRARFDVRYEPELVDRRNGLLQAMAEADALIVRNRSQVDAALLASAPRLRAVGRLGVGLDNIDLTACRARHRRGAGDGRNARAVAEYVIGTLLVLLRGAYGASAAVADGQWPRAALSGTGGAWPHAGRGGLRRHRPPGRDAGARPGHASSATTRRCRPAILPGANGVESCSLDALLERADAVSLHLPLTPGTQRLFDAARIGRMRAGAVLINTSRGGILDEPALAEALRAAGCAARRWTCSRPSRCRPAAAGRPAGRHPSGQADRPARPDPHAPYRRTDTRSQRPRFRHGGVRCDNSPPAATDERFRRAH